MPPLRYFPLLAFVLVTGASTVQGQPSSDFGFKIGITAAESYSFASGDARWGPTASLFIAQPLTKRLALLVEGGYQAKGSRREYEFWLDTEDGERYGGYDSRLDFGFLLLAPHYENTLGTSGLRLFAFAGPRLDAFLGENFRLLESRSSANDPLPVIRFFDGVEYNPFVLGATAGIGVNLSDVARIPLLAELRYNGDITPSRAFGTDDQYEVRHRTFDFRLGLSF